MMGFETCGGFRDRGKRAGKNYIQFSSVTWRRHFPDSGAIPRRASAILHAPGVGSQKNRAGKQFNRSTFRNNGVALCPNGVGNGGKGVAFRNNGVAFHFHGVGPQNHGVPHKINGFAKKSPISAKFTGRDDLPVVQTTLVARPSRLRVPAPSRCEIPETGGETLSETPKAEKIFYKEPRKPGIENRKILLSCFPYKSVSDCRRTARCVEQIFYEEPKKPGIENNKILLSCFPNESVSVCRRTARCVEKIFYKESRKPGIENRKILLSCFPNDFSPSVLANS